MGISHIDNTNLGKTQFITATISGEPNWSIIPTARKSSKSHNEFVNEIKELARKAAMTTNKTELENINAKRTKLCAEYLSDVAPDRKMLYQQAKNVLKNQSSDSKSRGIGELTLLDFLEDAEGKISNLAEKKFALAGGGTLTCPILTGEGHGTDIYYQGTKVLTYLGAGYGWGYESTPAEREKQKEFYDIYFKEYRSVKNGAGAELAELPDYLEDKPTFDQKA